MLVRTGSSADTEVRRVSKSTIVYALRSAAGEHSRRSRSRCEHGRRRSRQGARSAARCTLSALRARPSALSLQGVRWCINLRARSSAQICKECGGGGICEHGGALKASASTVVSALSARSVVGLKSASTVVSANGAKSAVVHQSASTVVALSVQGVRWGLNLRARSSALSVQGVRWVWESASTVVSALGARSAVEKIEVSQQKCRHHIFFPLRARRPSPPLSRVTPPRQTPP